MIPDLTENTVILLIRSLQPAMQTLYEESGGMPASPALSVNASVTRSSYYSVQISPRASYER